MRTNSWRAHRSSLTNYTEVPLCAGVLNSLGRLAGIPVGQASLGLIAFISFFLFAALFNGNYGESAIDDDKTY